jgi:hypothetical protein
MLETILLITLWAAALGVVCLWADWRRDQLQKLIDAREKNLLDKKNKS